MATLTMKNRDMSKQFFEEARSEEENCVCAECAAANPQWASVTLGSYFCLVCSGVHRSLGVHISFVRSLTMDAWSDKQLSIMRHGGNAKLKEYLTKHGVSPTASIQEKYSSKAAEAYRQQLRALAEGSALPPDPPAGTGQQPFYDTPTIPTASVRSGVSPVRTPPEASTPIDQNAAQAWAQGKAKATEGFWSVFGMAKSAAESLKETATSTVEHAQREGWVDSVTQVAAQSGAYVKSTATQAATWGATQASTGMQLVSESDAYKTTTATIGEALSGVGVAERFRPSGGSGSSPEGAAETAHPKEPAAVSEPKKDLWLDDDW